MSVSRTALLLAAAICAATSPTAQAKDGLPPWWILNGVRPAGQEKDMGTYTVQTFSKEQQHGFGVGEAGEVVDANRFDAALRALRAGQRLVVAQEPMIAPLRQLVDPAGPQVSGSGVEVPKGYMEPIMV
mmetsp:Transcript_3925/g.10823  ORF Transcript_3925/g.10823 Transcript_3925/m.10823 type:complete len:129 (+) Transcript_3925:825-1211(+)